MAEKDILDVIEKPVGTMKILIYMLQNNQTTVTGMLKNEDLNQRTTYSALEKLQKEGLVRCHKNKGGFPVRKYYTLTDRGKDIAQRLDMFVVGGKGKIEGVLK